MSFYPKVLHVDTSIALPNNFRNQVWDETVDYHVYENISPHWRKLETILKLDLYLALVAKKMSRRFDVILGGSENVGFPLTFLNIDRPLVVTVYSITHPLRKNFGKLTGISKRWLRIGVLVDAHKDYLGKYFAYPSEKIFRYLSAPLDIFTPDFSISGNYILSMGVARRDYPTLIKALGKLPKCTTQIYAASRYFEIYKGGIPEKFPKWIDINTNYGMTTDGIVDLYRNARFVVIPLKTSHQLAAGGSTVLEAMATGKAVIATDTPGMRDFIIDGVTGFLVPPGDDGSLRERISSLWNEPEKATRMGIEARKYAQEKYDPEILNLGMRQAILGAYLDSSSKPARA